MRIAIIGSGISGLVCARLLCRDHEVTVLEADSRVGGHVNTVSIEEGGESLRIDTGFIVFNDRTYPMFSKLIDDLQVESESTSMSFSVRCDRSGVEYNGTSLNGLFAQRRNIFRPDFYQMIGDITKFNREGQSDLSIVSDDETVGEYVTRNRYSKTFIERYLFPMGAAIWSCPGDEFARFPIRFILDFYTNHGLLSLRNRPVWRVIRGGANRYVERLVAPFGDRIRLNSPVSAVSRCDSEVLVSYMDGSEIFDEVIFACHSDQALKLLSDSDLIENDLLSAFPYSTSSAVLHTDESVLPRSRRAWASWNYLIPLEPTGRPMVTYNMNILQNLKSRRRYSVTLNADDRIDPAKVLKKFVYSHPVFTTRRASVQKRHDEVIRRRRTSFCGAYWRNGFHEDGVVSALAVCRKFGIPGWTAETAPLSGSLQAIGANDFKQARARGQGVDR